MEITRIKVEDFCCFSEFDLPVDKSGLVWVSGVNNDSEAASSNGSGKSTIFKALVWGLYGNTIDGERGDNVVRAGAKRATVCISLANESGTWTVKRTRKKGSGTLGLLLPSGEKFEASNKEIQQRVNDLLGLDFLAFRNTVYYGQNDINRFTNSRTTDTERKEMLHCILRSNIFAACRDLVRDDKKSIEGNVAQFDTELARIVARLEEYDIERLAANVRAWDEEHEAKARRRKEWLTELSEALLEAQAVYNDSVIDQDELERRNQEVSEWKAQIDLIQVGIDSLRESTDEQLGECTEKQDTLRAKRTAVVEIIAMHSAKLELLNESIKKLDGDKCPVCNTSFQSDGVTTYRDELFEEMELTDDKCEKAKQLSGVIGKKIGAIEEERAVLLAVSDASNKTWEADQKGFQEKINKAQAEFHVDEMNRVVAEKDMHLAKSELEFAQGVDISDEENPHTQALDAAKEKIVQYSKESKALEKKLKAARTELSYAEFWNKGFSNQGVASYVLDSIMPYITERANYYLDILSDGDIKVLFSTQKELKSSKNEYRDKIDITWMIEGQELSYPPSGGQAKKIEIATDLALMDLVSYREGHNTNILILDEVLDGLDEVGRQRVLQLLQEINKFRSSVFVISHDSNMSEVFESYITVEKNDGVSKIKNVSA